MSNTYAVEERIGCVAVVDTREERPGPGLHPTDHDVVAFWHGRWKGDHWTVPKKYLRRARKLVKALNHTEGSE